MEFYIVEAHARRGCFHRLEPSPRSNDHWFSSRIGELRGKIMDRRGGRRLGESLQGCSTAQSISGPSPQPRSIDAKTYQDLISRYKLEGDLRQFVLEALRVWTAPRMHILRASNRVVSCLSSALPVQTALWMPRSSRPFPKNTVYPSLKSSGKSMCRGWKERARTTLFKWQQSTY